MDFPEVKKEPIEKPYDSLLVDVELSKHEQLESKHEVTELFAINIKEDEAINDDSKSQNNEFVDCSHNSSQHTGPDVKEKPFKCNQCIYTCSRRDHFLEHYLIHSGEKLFKCKVCEYKAFRKRDLVRHTKLHDGELFKCKQCTYASIRKSDLVLHLKRHSGDKSFECKNCTYKTYRKYHLDRHYRLIHSERKCLSVKHVSLKCFKERSV